MADVCVCECAFMLKQWNLCGALGVCVVSGLCYGIVPLCILLNVVPLLLRACRPQENMCFACLPLMKRVHQAEL